MLLQELPSELFAKIIGALARVLEAKRLVDHRLVSPKFNSFIMDHVLNVVARRCITGSLTGNEAYKQLFKHHAGKILTKKLMYHGTTSNSFLQFLKHLVDTFMSLERHLSSKKEYELREQYTGHICHAVIALEPEHLRSYILEGAPVTTRALKLSQSTSVAIAAAVGDVPMVLHRLSSVKDILRAEPGFPNALNAAVAASQTWMVEMMLNYIHDTIKRPWETKNKTWDEMRAAATGLYDALLVAVRLHNHEIANMIVQALAQNEALGHSIAPKLRRQFHEACVCHENVEFYSRVLHYKRHRTWEALKKTDDESQKPAEDEVRYLLKRCSKWMLRRLIETQQLEPNYVGQYDTPIFLALSVRRRELVKVLLEGGVGIDGFPRRGGGTTMYRAGLMGWHRNATYLKLHHFAHCVAASE